MRCAPRHRVRGRPRAERNRRSWRSIVSAPSGQAGYTIGGKLTEPIGDSIGDGSRVRG